MTDIRTLKMHTQNIKGRLMDMRRGSDSVDLSSVIREIQRVRRSGEKPLQTIGEKDLFAYECELCLLKIKEGELTQCPFCGRWVCKKDCYSDEEGSCISCESTIRLKRESIIHLKDMVRSIDGNKSEDETAVV